MHSVNLECFEQLGWDVDDLADINFYAHYQNLSKIPSWAEWDGAVNDAMQDLKEENGVDW